MLYCLSFVFFILWSEYVEHNTRDEYLREKLFFSTLANMLKSVAIKYKWPFLFLMCFAYFVFFGLWLSYTNENIYTIKVNDFFGFDMSFRFYNL